MKPERHHKPVSEAGFQAQVIELARWSGFLVYHTFDSRHSAAGFPDLVCVRPPRVLFIELKSAKGIVTSDQADWMERLWGCPGVEAYIWRPADWPTIERVLAKR